MGERERDLLMVWSEEEAGRGGERETERILRLTFIVTISIMGVIEVLGWLKKWVSV